MLVVLFLFAFDKQTYYSTTYLYHIIQSSKRYAINFTQQHILSVKHKQTSAMLWGGPFQCSKDKTKYNTTQTNKIIKDNIIPFICLYIMSVIVYSILD
jgi:hypothetical protein